MTREHHENQLVMLLNARLTWSSGSHIDAWRGWDQINLWQSVLLALLSSCRTWDMFGVIIPRSTRSTSLSLQSQTTEYSMFLKNGAVLFLCQVVVNLVPLSSSRHQWMGLSPPLNTKRLSLLLQFNFTLLFWHFYLHVNLHMATKRRCCSSWHINRLDLKGQAVHLYSRQLLNVRTLIFILLFHRPQLLQSAFWVDWLCVYAGRYKPHLQLLLLLISIYLFMLTNLKDQWSTNRIISHWF